MTTIIHVNRQFIAMNAKDGGRRPVYIVRQGNHVRYGREVLLSGPSRFVDPSKPLPCGARAWLETDFPVAIIDEATFAEAKACGLQK